MQLQPFLFMKPLADALEKIGNGTTNGSFENSINTILFGIDLFILFGMVSTVILFFFGLGRYFFKKMKACDELEDPVKVAAQNKKQLKNILWATLGLSILFIILPAVISIVGAALGGNK